LASAYTPGLTVSGDIVVRRLRRLPIKGEVIVEKGAQVEPDQVLARAMLPGVLQTIKLAERLSVEAKDAGSLMTVKIGDAVEKGQVVAEGKKLFGLFKAAIATTDYTGTIESVSDVTGNALLREPPIPVGVTAYVQGRIAEIIPNEGAIVETRCAMVQGIFGVGGERTGTLRMAVAAAGKVLEEGDILDSDRGKFLVGGSGVTYEAIKKASDMGVKGLIVGGVKDADLTKFLGYDIGVAITGTEAIELTLIVTEGFGFLAMAERTFDLLKSLEGRAGSINGATQIRAGVIRPELLVPVSSDVAAAPVASQVFELKAGTPIRVIREPYFGRLGAVTALPATLVTLESGTEVRVLRARLDTGEEVTVPRANVEIMATA